MKLGFVIKKKKTERDKERERGVGRAYECLHSQKKIAKTNVTKVIS